MSIETKIEALTAAIAALTVQLQNRGAAAPLAAPVAPAPVYAPPMNPAPSLPPASVMPAPPMFAMPVAPAPTGAPFADPKGLIEYVMGAYKAMGPNKGAQIQGVLTGLGYQNINDVQPGHYTQLFAGIEALKAS